MVLNTEDLGKMFSAPSETLNWVRDLESLIAIDSPTGFTNHALDFLENRYINLGLSCRRTSKGTLIARRGEQPHLAFAAHVDTLGAMVSEIRTDGTLGVAKVGGLLLPSFEGEYCRIYTHSGTIFKGTFLLNNPSAHVNRSAGTATRDLDSMHVRVDAQVRDAESVRTLGINVGDYIAFHPRFEFIESTGFIKSRFLDNKAGCIVLLEAARHFHSHSPSVEFHFTSFEEVGHGCAPLLAPNIRDLIVIDMGVVGDNRTGSEFACSICALDSSGPYNYELRKELYDLAQQFTIPCHVDVYPFYSSDGSAAMAGGNEVRVGLIGPGIAASHGVERTHVSSIEASIKLVLTFLESQKTF